MNKKDILKNKKVIFVLLAIVLVLVVTVVSVVMVNNNKETKKKVEKESKEAITEQGIIKDETFGNLNFSNTTLMVINILYQWMLLIQHKVRLILNKLILI